MLPGLVQSIRVHHTRPSLVRTDWLRCPALAAEERRADRFGAAAAAPGLGLHGWLGLPVPLPHDAVLYHPFVSYKPIVGWVDCSLSVLKLHVPSYSFEFC